MCCDVYLKTKIEHVLSSTMHYVRRRCCRPDCRPPSARTLRHRARPAGRPVEKYCAMPIREHNDGDAAGGMGCMPAPLRFHCHCNGRRLLLTT
jgi:hypothetical protein